MRLRREETNQSAVHEIRQKKTETETKKKTKRIKKGKKSPKSYRLTK